MAEPGKPLPLTEKIAVFALIGGSVAQAIPMIAATRSFILLFALGGALFLCRKAVWQLWKRLTVALVFVLVYLAIVLLLFEQEARATKTASPTAAVLATIANVFWGIPWRWVVPSLLVGAAVAELLTVRRVRKWPRHVGIEPKEACPDEWLHRVENNDKAVIKELVWVSQIRYYEDFERTQSSINFVFVIFNISIFDIVIDGSLENSYLLYGDEYERFHFDPKFEGKTPTICRGRTGTNFVIRQAVTQDELTRRFKQADDTRIAFGNLHIGFSGTEQHSEIPPTSLETNHYLQTAERKWDNPNHPEFLTLDKKELPSSTTGQTEVELALVESRSETHRLQKELSKLSEGIGGKRQQYKTLSQNYEKLENALAEKESQVSSLTHIDVQNDLYVTVRARFDTLISDNRLGFQVHIFNGSSRRVSIDWDVSQNNVKGFILAGERPLPTKPTLRKINHFRPPSRLIVLEIEQQLAPSDAKELDRTLNEGTFVQFLFTELDIYMTVDGLDEKQRLPLPGGVDCQKGICSNRVVIGKVNFTL